MNLVLPFSLLPPIPHLVHTKSQTLIRDSNLTLLMTFELQFWIPLFTLFSVVSPITFLLWSAAGKKNNTFALVIVAEDLLLAYISMSCRIYVLELIPHRSNSTWGCGGLGCEKVKELIAMNGAGLALSGGHSNKSPLWIVKGQVLLDPEPSRIFSVLCLGPGRMNIYFL